MLEDILRIKTEESIYDCFLWKDGDFMFEEGRLPEQIPISLPLDLTGVILEGARRTDEWERIHEVFPTRLTTFVIDHEQIEAAKEITDEDRRVLELVARGKNLAEISLELHAVEFYAASRLFELHERKLVRVREAPEGDRLRRPGTGRLREKLKSGRRALQLRPVRERPRRLRRGALPRRTEQVRAALRDQDRSGFSRIGRTSPTSPSTEFPASKVTMVELAQLDLDPQEGFVLSRVNGEWDVDSITKICPMGEQEVLIIFKRLVDQGLIEFGGVDQAPMPVWARLRQPVPTT